MQNNKFLKIKSCKNIGGTDYYYAERLGKDSVAFILFDTHKNKFGLVNEFKPPIGKFMITAFGGSLDKNKTIQEILIEEIREEAGYVIDSNFRILNCGEYLVSTQMNQFCHCFAINVTGLDVQERQPENKAEAAASVVWMDYYDLMKQTHDWKCQVIARQIRNFNNLLEV